MLRLIVTAQIVTIVVFSRVPASASTEDCVGEYCFTTPGLNETKKFDDAGSWCMGHNSTFVVVNDSVTQAALTQFLRSSKMNDILFINIKLYQHDNTWFIVDGTQYKGAVGNQNYSEYKLYGFLRPDTTPQFLVEASRPNERRQYICDFEDTMCRNASLIRNFHFKDRCYVKYEDERLTWFAARESCIQKGGDLARFQNDLNVWIPPFTTTWLNISMTYWVGIRQNGSAWRYPDNGTEITYTFWSAAKPNTINYECVCVNSTETSHLSWTDCYCNTQRQFVCLKIVPTTTALTTTTTTTPTTTTTTSATTNAPNASNVANQLSQQQIIGLGAGIGGGGALVIIVIIIIVLTVVIMRRKRKTNEHRESRIAVERSNEEDDNYEIENNEVAGSRGKDLYTQVQKPPRNPANNSRGKDAYAQVNKPTRNPVTNDVYAKVISGENKQQTNNIETSPEIVYSAPEFAQDPKSAPTNSAYEVANRVKEPDAVPSLRGQTHSIFPGRQNNAYANDDVDD